MSRGLTAGWAWPGDGPPSAPPACLRRLSTGEISSWRTPATAPILVVTYSYRASESRGDGAGRGGRPAVAQAISGGQAQRLLAGQPAGQRDALDQIVHAASAAAYGTFLLAGVPGSAGAVIALAGLSRRPARRGPPSPRPPARHVWGRRLPSRARPVRVRVCPAGTCPARVRPPGTCGAGDCPAGPAQSASASAQPAPAGRGAAVGAGAAESPVPACAGDAALAAGARVTAKAGLNDEAPPGVR